MTYSRRKSLKECVRHVTWAWHTVVMGTGSVSALAARFHFGTDSVAIKVITLFFFFLNLGLFVLITGATVARYCMFPEVWWKTLRHPAQSLFVGAFAVGAATLINSALVANQKWSFGGTPFLYTLWGLWWADLVISFLTAFGMLYIMMTTQHHSLAKMASVWVLPIITLIVASSTGGLLSDALRAHSIQLAILTTAVSFSALIMGLSIALMMITVYLMRLILCGPPDANLILSAFVVLGPLGQGGFSLLINGQNLSELLPLHLGGSFPFATLMGQMIYSACFCGAWILWSMGVAWVVIALFSIYSVARKERIPFSLGYWGTIFPNGVFALLSVQLGIVLDSPFFHYFGVVWSVLVLALWIFVSLKTLPVVWDTSIFVAPCLTLPEKPSLAVILTTSDRTVDVV